MASVLQRVKAGSSIRNVDCWDTQVVRGHLSITRILPPSRRPARACTAASAAVP